MCTAARGIRLVPGPKLLSWVPWVCRNLQSQNLPAGAFSGRCLSRMWGQPLLHQKLKRLWRMQLTTCRDRFTAGYAQLLNPDPELYSLCQTHGSPCLFHALLEGLAVEGMEGLESLAQEQLQKLWTGISGLQRLSEHALAQLLAASQSPQPQEAKHLLHSAKLASRQFSSPNRLLQKKSSASRLQYQRIGKGKARRKSFLLCQQMF